MRLFVAVWPDEPARAALESLPRPTVGGVRWTTPDQWHVTLAFLGEVPEEGAGPVGAAVEAAARGSAPAWASLGPATARLGRAVLCVPVDGLDALAQAARTSLRDSGLGPPVVEDLAFRGHCTLARARRGRSIPASLAGMAVSAGWPVTAVCLLRSTLDPGGARYETLLTATVRS